MSTTDHPFTAIESYENEQGEDAEREVQTSYETISDLIEELRENAIDFIEGQYEDELEVYDAFAAYHGEYPSNREELEALLDRADENYRGHHQSWADMAQEDAESLYDIPDHWPYNCIDWAKAGEELKYDVGEHNGYFFWRHG